jgi:hypothetical protein
VACLSKMWQSDLFGRCERGGLPVSRDQLCHYKSILSFFGSIFSRRMSIRHMLSMAMACTSRNEVG